MFHHPGLHSLWAVCARFALFCHDLMSVAPRRNAITPLSTGICWVTLHMRSSSRQRIFTKNLLEINKYLIFLRFWAFCCFNAFVLCPRGCCPYRGDLPQLTLPQAPSQGQGWRPARRRNAMVRAGKWWSCCTSCHSQRQPRQRIGGTVLLQVSVVFRDHLHRRASQGRHGGQVKPAGYEVGDGAVTQRVCAGAVI